MDPLDTASARAMEIVEMALPDTGLPCRDLTPPELSALALHMSGTDMRVTDALRALQYDVRRLSLDDLEALDGKLTRCPSCDCWAFRDELVDGICPICRNPFA